MTAAPTRPPASRRSGAGSTVVLPLVLAAVLGVGAGLAPRGITLVAAGAAALLLVVLRLEWVALLLVVASVFEDYLAQAGVPATRLLAAMLVIGWAVRRCRGPLHSASRDPVLLAALGFAVTLLLATAVHNNGTPGLTVGLRYAGFLAVLFVLAEVQRGRILSPDRLARGYVVACAAASVCGLATFALGLDRRAGGPIGDPNDFAFFLVPAVALAVGVRAGARRRWCWDLAVVLLLVTILATLSRGALVGLLVLGVFAVASGMVRVRIAAIIALAGALAAGAVALLLPGMVSVSLEQKDVVADQNVTERLDLWGAAARMTAEDPVLGQGPGAFALRHDDYLSSLPADVNHPLDVAHNTWLELSSELGLLGLFAFVGLLAAAFVQGWISWRRHRDPLGAALSAGLVGAVVTATFVTEQFYLPLWLLCALAVGVSSRERMR